MANVNVILDEAASLGPNMGCIEDGIDKYRGYGIRLQLYYQSPAQLKKCFPNDQDQTVLANVTQVFFGVNDNAAEYISNRLGDQTIVVDSGGQNQGYSSQSGSHNQQNSSYSHSSNSNWSQMGRRLLKSDEVLAMSDRQAITFVPGLRPVLTTMHRYYEKDCRRKGLKGFGLLLNALMVLLVMTGCVCASIQRLDKNQVGQLKGVNTFVSETAGELKRLGTQSWGRLRDRP